MDLAADAVALSTLFGRADSALVPFIEEPQPDQPLEAELGSPLLAEQLGEVLQGIAWPAAHVFAPQVGETAYPNFAGGAQGMVLDDLKFDELLELFDADVAMDDVLGGPLVAPEEWNGADLSGAGPQPQVVLQQQGLLQRQSQPHLGHARYQQEEEERIQLQMLGSLNSELPLMGLPVFTSPMPAVALWQPQYPETAPAGRGPTPSSSSQQTGTAHIQPSQLAEREASSKVMEQSGNARPPPQPAPSPPPPRALEPEGRAETFLKQISEAFSSRQEQKKVCARDSSKEHNYGRWIQQGISFVERLAGSWIAMAAIPASLDAACNRDQAPRRLLTLALSCPSDGQSDRPRAREQIGYQNAQGQRHKRVLRQAWAQGKSPFLALVLVSLL